MGTRLLGLLIRHDHSFPECGVRVIVDYLTHDLLAMRKVGGGHAHPGCAVLCCQ